MSQNSINEQEIPSPHLPALASRPELAIRARVWHYAVTHWQRLFGLNVSPIDTLLFVGGQFPAQHWPHLHALGIRAVLSLQAEREDTFIGPPPRTLRLSVEDMTPPSLDQLGQACRFIHGAHADSMPVFIHCYAGVGRAPLTASAYLVTRGLSSSAALAYISHARPIVALNRIQHERLLEWEQLIRNQPDAWRS